MTPETLGRYAIKAELGRGSMGVVYRGHDPVIDRAVAIKTVSIPEGVSDAEREAFLTRFFQEARTAGKLLHPNIVVTYDAATDESTGTPFIAMELVEGETLATRLRAAPPVSWQQSLEWCAAIARALDHAHRHGVIHRDIKPANVMLTPLGVPKLADFGIAKLAAANLTATGIVMGTPYFMSPEQVEGKQLDGRSDLFTVGALVYTLVTGERPFEGRELASIAAQILYKNPNPPSELRPELPASLDGVVARALMKSPTDRYATGEELAAELDAVRQGRAPARPATVGESTRASVAVATAFQRVESAPDGAASTASTPSTVDAPRPLSTYPKRRLVAAAGALVVLVSMVVAVFYREDIAQRMLFRDAVKAVEGGQLDRGERILEELLERNPELDEASAFLLRVSGELVLPLLPIERTAVHDHRLGDCTGRLVLHPWGIEFSSRKHVWKWRFEELVTVDRRGARGIFLATREGDMMGLLDTKNYNFSTSGEPLDPETWKRYERLYRDWTRETREPREPES